MSYSQADLDRLDRAIADGALMVTLSDGSSTRYRDIAELKDARRHVAEQMSAVQGGTPRRRGVTTYSTKGVY